MCLHVAPTPVLLLLGFLLIMFGFYSLIPILLSFSNAALMNLSFLTSDLWAILAGVFIFDDSVRFLPLLELLLPVAVFLALPARLLPSHVIHTL